MALKFAKRKERAWQILAFASIIESTDRYGVARYVPVITEDDYILSEEKAVLEKFGSAKKLVIAMIHNGHLTDTDIDELSGFFKMGDSGD